MSVKSKFIKLNTIFQGMRKLKMKKKDLKRFVRFTGIITVTLLIMIIFKYGLIIKQYKEVKLTQEHLWTSTQHPFYNEHTLVEFYVNQENIDLNLWWASLTGSIEVKITDESGKEYFSEKSKKINKEFTLDLEGGRYQLEINVSDFTGAIALGYGKVIKINELPSDQYRMIESNGEKGFYWSYILYVPEKVTQNNLLIVPNNTGMVSDNMDLHSEAAKQLILSKSKLAQELGVPLLVPIFPRPESNQELYTHALDRGTLLTDITQLKRLDLQLIAMIDDSKETLAQEGINLDDKILLSGFSAAGDFTDRFTFLHPEIVKAAVIGGSDNMIPFKELNHENLPYPIGIYDYEKITGKEFDEGAFAAVERYIYKGSEDEGGWMTCEENGEITRYTGQEYFEKFDMPQLIELGKQVSSPMYTEGLIAEFERKQISFIAYEGKAFVDLFVAIKDIYNVPKWSKNEFVIYEGIGHEINDDILQQELEFFERVLTD